MFKNKKHKTTKSMYAAYIYRSFRLNAKCNNHIKNKYFNMYVGIVPNHSGKHVYIYIYDPSEVCLLLFQNISYILN